MPEEELVFREAFAVDDEVQGEGDVVLEGEEVEVLGAGGRAQGLLAWVEIELLWLKALYSLDLLENCEVFDFAGHLFIEWVTVCSRSLYTELQ